MLIAYCYTERKTESTYKKKNLYIFIYRQKEKEGAKRAQKKGYQKVALK